MPLIAETLNAIQYKAFLILLVVLSLQKGVDGQEQAVTLKSLSDEQIKQAVEEADAVAEQRIAEARHLQRSWV